MSIFAQFSILVLLTIIAGAAVAAVWFGGKKYVASVVKSWEGDSWKRDADIGWYVLVAVILTASAVVYFYPVGV